MWCGPWYFMPNLYARCRNCEAYFMKLPFNTRCLGVQPKKVPKKFTDGPPSLFIFFRILWDDVMQWNLSSGVTGWYMEVTLLILNKLYGKWIIHLMSLDESPQLIWLQRALAYPWRISINIMTINLHLYV